MILALCERPYGVKGYDTKCPDGFTTNGWRKVCKGGYVNFQHAKRYAPEFLDCVGLYVFMEISDCWAIEAHCYSGGAFAGDTIGTYNAEEWAALSEEERQSEAPK